MRVCNVILPVAALALWASQCAAVPVRVVFDWPADNSSPTPARVHIRAVRAVGPTNQSAPVETDAAANGAVLDLNQGVWLVQASAPAYWSQGVEITIAAQAQSSVRVALWPAATLHGQIVAAEGELLPAALDIRLSGIPAASAEPTTSAPQPNTTPSHAELRCEIAAGAWTCLGPAGLFDARLEAAGYAPRYVWGVSLKAGESLDLGRTALRRSASVVGRAVRKDGSDPPGPCRATLQSDTERRSGPEPDPDSAPAGEPTFSMPLSARGYFQVVGVLPGRHVLAVDCQTASGFREFIVQPDGETSIKPPLQLEEEMLTIGVTPQFDPEGRPWKLSVEATTPRLRRIADKITLPADGHWERRGLMAGNYRLTVSAADGTTWLQRNVDLSARSGPLSLQLASVRVTGRVMLASQPVRARLLFSNQAGGEPATLKSDSDGRFQGFLPVAPDSRETTWMVEAHVAQPPSTRRIAGVNVTSVAGGASAWIDLALPTIAVRGAVVSEDGKPQPGTQVRFEDSGGRRTTTSTDDAGSFEMPDLPPGKYTAVAESDDGASDPAPFDVVDGSEKALTLIVHPSMRIPFHVASNQGPVSDAAVQVWIDPGVPRAFARSDQNGRFEVKLPRGTTQVGLTVGAPGYAIKLTRMAVSDPADPTQNDNTITLSTAAGTLELGFQPAERALDPSVTLYLAHNGAIQDARTIAGWGTSQAGTSGDGPAVVEAIEPGDYALCVLADPSEVATIWLGTLPPDRCRMGTVKQGQTLTLEPR